MNRYRLCSHVEEFHCPECGRPVYVREHAVEHQGERFCSPRCAEDATGAAFVEVPVKTPTLRTVQTSLF